MCAPGCSFCSAPSDSCCSSPARTSQTCCSCVEKSGGRSWRCESHWERAVVVLPARSSARASSCRSSPASSGCRGVGCPCGRSGRDRPGGLPRVDSVRIDGGVVLFVAGSDLVTTVLAALVPALAAGARQSGVTHAGRRSAVTGSTRQGRGVLVAAQVALAVTVVAAAGLVTRSLLRLQSTGTELGADRLVSRVALPAAGPLRRSRTPSPVSRGRRRASRSDARDFGGDANQRRTVFRRRVGRADGYGRGTGCGQVARNGSLNLEAIQPGYFDTFGVALVRGRPFDDRDREEARRRWRS